mgnify:CR=1 FL=1
MSLNLLNSSLYQEGVRGVYLHIHQQLSHDLPQYESSFSLSNNSRLGFFSFIVKHTDKQKQIELSSPNITLNTMQVNIWEDEDITNYFSADCYEFDDWRDAYEFFLKQAKRLMAIAEEGKTHE